MTTTPKNKLVRKQILISPGQIKKLNRIARHERTSVAEIVRAAIDAYNPVGSTLAGMDDQALMDLVSTRLKEAIASTRKANRTIHSTLKKFSNGRSKDY